MAEISRLELEAQRPVIVRAVYPSGLSVYEARTPQSEQDVRYAFRSDVGFIPSERIEECIRRQHHKPGAWAGQDARFGSLREALTYAESIVEWQMTLTLAFVNYFVVDEPDAEVEQDIAFGLMRTRERLGVLRPSPHYQVIEKLSGLSPAQLAATFDSTPNYLHPGRDEEPSDRPRKQAAGR